jgi:hypothetical protein
MRRATTSGISMGIVCCATRSQPQLRTCAAALRVRPAIRARHTRVKTGVGSALCKDESEGFRQGKKGRNCEAARCTQSSYVRQMCCRGDVDDDVAAELDRDVVARAWSNARPATL